MDPYWEQRRRMVAVVQANTGLSDPRVAEAFLRVPRHEFVPPSYRAAAYDDRALPLAEEQTISQPSMIAVMLDALRCRPADRALEVGAGCGYAAALLAELVSEVYGIEIRPALAELARQTLNKIGTTNVQIVEGDGNLGLPSQAPFDVILVSAAPRRVPEALLAQLALGGRIAVPVGGGFHQVLEVGVRRSSGIEWTHSIPCAFVPLIQP